MIKEVLAASVIGAMSLTGSGAHSVPQDAKSATASAGQQTPVKALKYSDEDVVSFFVLHTGPIFDSRPDLAEKFGYTRTSPSPKVVSEVMALFHQIDPKLHERVTAAVQSGDPVRAEAGVKALTDDFNKVVAYVKETKAHKGTVSPMDYNNGPVSNFVDTITWVALAAWALGAVAVIAGAVVVLFYNPDNTATEYDRQLNALAIAKSLG